MTRFAALDLDSLPDPSEIVDLDFDAVLEARLTELESRLAEAFSADEVAETMALARNIAASPLRYLNEAAAARELYLGNRINTVIRTIFLATATGGDLDQLGANRGVVRHVLDDSDPDALVLEDDATFRARIQLVIEAISPFGGAGSYVYWALDADARVVDVAVYGPNDDLDPAIPPAEPKMVILSSDADGTASEALIETVRAHCSADDRRPVADKLTVISATPVLYQINATLHVTSASAAATVEAAARLALDNFLAGRIRIGRSIYLSSVAAALNVDGVVDVVLNDPIATIPVGPFEAGHCTDVSISIVSITGGWRDG